MQSMTTDIAFPQPARAVVAPPKAGRIYWVCQIGGWTLMFVLNEIGALAVRPFHWPSLFVNAALSLLGLVATHLLRAISHKRGWHQLAIPKLLARVAVAIALCVSTTLLALVILDAALDALFSQPLAAGSSLKLHWEAGAWLVMAVNVGAVYLTWCLIYFGVHVLRRQQRAETERWKMQAALSSAELAALKAQLNPHFLFNALNGLRALVVEDPTRAQEVVTRLAAILRYSLQANERETVPLSEELQMVDDYLDLETIRFEERLRVVRDISPATAAVAIPPMVVQTLVENAIKYGVSRRPEGGEIQLSARIDGEVLEVKVINRGELGPSDDGTGMGLRNAAERIHRLWGEAASLRLTEHPAGSVTATLRLPR